MTHPLRPFSCSSTTALLPLHPLLPSPNFNPQRVHRTHRHPRLPRPPFSSSPPLSPLPSSSFHFLRATQLPPPSPTSSTPFLVLPVPTRSSSSFLPTARTFRHLLLLRSNDQAARKAGFKIIMARAILITVARTTTHSPTTVYSPPHTLAHTSQQLCL